MISTIFFPSLLEIKKPPKPLHFKILIPFFDIIFPRNKNLILLLLLLLLPIASHINGKCEHEGMLTFAMDVNKRGAKKTHACIHVRIYVYWHGIWAVLTCSLF
jgi:hypothetical protein